MIPTFAEAKAAAALAAAFFGADPSLAPVAPPANVSPLSVAPTLAIADTVVVAGARVATVAVTLSAAARRPLAWRCLTANGTAYEGGFYRRTDAVVLFNPGETVKTIDVPVLRDLGTAAFKLNCAWSRNSPPIAGASGMVRGGVAGDAGGLAPVRRDEAVAFTPPAREAGRTLAFSTTFMEPIVPDARPGTWRSRFGWGRVQTGNKEIAPYTDATTDPGVTPHPIVDGKRVLRAEHVATTDAGKGYAYSASLIDSANLFTFQYGYVEARVKFARSQGTAAALWLLPASGRWPPEIDVFETGLNDSPAFASTIHFAHDGYGTQEGVAVPQAVEDGQWHTIGFDWTPAWQVTLIDGVEVVRRPNTFDEPMKIVFDVSVGGLGPDPVSPGPGWKSELALDYLKVWR